MQNAKENEILTSTSGKKTQLPIRNGQLRIAADFSKTALATVMSLCRENTNITLESYTKEASFKMEVKQRHSLAEPRASHLVTDWWLHL